MTSVAFGKRRFSKRIEILYQRPLVVVCAWGWLKIMITRRGVMDISTVVLRTFFWGN